MRKVERYKFGYIREQNVVVLNNPSGHSFRVFGGDFLEDVKIDIGEGVLRVIGTKVCHDLYLHKTAEPDWTNEPEDDEIQVRKVGIFRRREERYLVGWVRIKKRVPFDMEFGSGWTLRRI